MAERAKALHKATRENGALSSLTGEKTAISALMRCWMTVVSVLIPTAICWTDLVGVDRDTWMFILCLYIEDVRRKKPVKGEWRFHPRTVCIYVESLLRCLRRTLSLDADSSLWYVERMPSVSAVLQAKVTELKKDGLMKDHASKAFEPHHFKALQDGGYLSYSPLGLLRRFVLFVGSVMANRGGVPRLLKGTRFIFHAAIGGAVAYATYLETMEEMKKRYVPSLLLMAFVCGCRGLPCFFYITVPYFCISSFLPSCSPSSLSLQNGER
jgi:hypothetical protein